MVRGLGLQLGLRVIVKIRVRHGISARSIRVRVKRVAVYVKGRFRSVWFLLWLVHPREALGSRPAPGRNSQRSCAVLLLTVFFYLQKSKLNNLLVSSRLLN